MSAEQGDSVEASHGTTAAGATPAATEPAKLTPPAAASAASDPAHVEVPNLAPDHGHEQSGPTQPAKAAPQAATAARSGQITIMSPVRNWDDRIGGEQRASSEAPRTGLFGKRRAAAMAAVIAVAAIAGALGGALATSSLSRPVADSSAVTKQTQALNEQIARLDADLAALKGNVDHSSKQTAAQLSQLGKSGDKTGDRFDKVEKAQADAATRLAKLSETIDKLKAPAPQPVAAAPAASQVAARDATGSVANAAAAAAKPEVARLPTVPGWVLHDVANGAAVIEGRQGMFEVYAGDPIPGLGRVDAIRRQDGRWVVVTSRGLIVAR
ncbi:hypothetical protein HNR60_004530 [Rhodopseudomonas rhenobacensis]|uniref:Uncharacterized protein n=1 Tax=Rhodopseudomonas rhenobacensis TaxID=87461 RepID=A0A7W8E2B6_9BRAD|nr:hypothetical protein [Rhodopseudomonas rhenobacensis]